MRQKIKIVAPFFFLAFAALSARGADEASDDFPVIVPTEMCGRFFMVPMHFEKHDPAVEKNLLWLLFDTGADVTVIDPDAIERVSGTDVRERKSVRFSDLRAGRLRVTKFNVLVRELDHIETAIGRPLDGILGFPFFKKYLLTLDYEKEQMRLDKGTLPAVDNKTVFSAKGKDKRPWLNAQLGSKKVKLLIDSGSNGIMSLHHLDRYPAFAPPTAVSLSQRINRVDFNDAIRSRADLVIGDHRVKTPIISSVNGSQLLGNQIMRHYRFTFDQKKRRVQIIRNSDEDALVPVEIPSLEATGPLMAPHKEGLEVRALLPVPDFAGLDVEVGDIAVEIDGKPALRKGCSPKVRAAKTSRVTFKRGDRLYERTLRPAIVVE